MNFLELSMENFRSYQPKTTIRFTEKEDRPIYTFVGENGSGKTTIFLAIIWALYGEEAILRYAETRKKDLQAPKNNLDLINKSSITNGGKAFCRVSLTFEHNSEKYYLFRTISSKGTNPRKNSDLFEDLSLRQGSSGKEESYAQGKINDILPIDAFQFFFFDGEDVRKYSGATSEQTRVAIERVLGIPEIREAREDIQKLERKLLNELGDQETISEELRKVTQALVNAKEDHNRFSHTLEAKRNELSKVKDELAVLEAKRETIKDITEFNNKLQAVKKESEATKETYDELITKRNELVKQLPFYLVAPKLREILEKFKRTAGTDNLAKEITQVNSRIDIISELLDPHNMQCICDRDLGDNTRSHLNNLKRTLEKQLEELKQRSSKKTTPPIEDIQYVLGSIESINVDFAKYEQRINEIKMKLLELDDRRRQIEDRIKGSNVKEAEAIQSSIENHRRSQGRLETEIGNLEGLVRDKEDLKQKLDSVYKKNQLYQGQLSSVSACHLLTEKLVSALDWIVKEMYEQKKAMIVENASHFFTNVAPKEGYNEISIENDYSVWLLGKNNEIEKPSEGYKELVALSFIYGLNKAASYNAPVVMDFVLGRLDSIRQLAVVNNFRDFAEQIIVLLLDTELLAEGVSSRLDSLSAQKYYINRDLKSGYSSIEVRQI